MKTKTSISHLTGKEQNALHCIKKKIIEHLPPLLIFCFNSNITQSINRSSFTSKLREEDWNFSCNLLIVVPNDATIGNDTKKEVEELVEQFGKVNAFIHPLDFVIQQLKDGNLFFTWVRRNAIILYNKDNSLQLLPPPISKHQEYQQQAEQFFSENPNFENYLEKKIIPVSQPSIGSKEQSAIKKIPIDLDSRMQEQPRQLFPQNLSPEEIANPHLVISSFFREYGLQDAKKYISSWMTAVYEKVDWVRKSPNNLIYFTERLFRLIEAGWLINQMDNSKRLANLSLQYDMEKIDLMNPDLYCKTIFKESPWEYFPRNLNQKDYTNPYKVFPKFFKFHTLNEWKDELRNILQLALSNFDIEDSGEAINTLGYKKRLDKLVDACHLINVREFEWSDGQLIYKIYNAATNETKD